ncbi:MAG: hypothetical protein ACI9KM_000485, partial [Rubritalea sp.]
PRWQCNQTLSVWQKTNGQLSVTGHFVITTEITTRTPKKCTYSMITVAAS